MRYALLLSALLAAAAPSHANATDCATLLPPSAVAGTPGRPITPEDLVRLRDIGQPGVEAAGLSRSPDRSRIAFQLRQAIPSGNRYCQGIFVVTLERSARPKAIDIGGDFIPVTYPRYGIAEYPAGVPALVTPRWSPDGRRLAYLRSDRGSVAVWVAHADGSAAEPVLRGDLDIQDVAWSIDGRRLIVRARPSLTDAQRAIDGEALRGFHFDERVVPAAGYRPFPAGELPFRYLAMDMATRRMSPASIADQSVLDPGVDPDRPRDAALFAKGQTGNSAWTAPDDPSLFGGQARLHVRWAGKASLACLAPTCDGHIARLWWAAGSLYFLHREGAGFGSLALYRWDAGDDQPRKLFATDDVLIDCEPADAKLVCVQEGSTQPRRIVFVDPQNGRIDPIFDPNPEFTQLTLGSVRRLTLPSALGSPTFGDLVLPPDYRPGTRYPVVIVQYQSRGFLRGGTGDEYPIFPMAARGLAVLSFQRPADIASGARSLVEQVRQNAAGWRDRTNVQSALQAAINQLIEEKIADPARIGISGLSDGTSTIGFALASGLPFRAVAMSTCCEDSFSLLTATGLNGSPIFRGAGYPSLTAPDPGFWKHLSIAANVATINTPILLQVSDDEAQLSLQSFLSLREQEKPVDMYVFPGERHVKWQPAHRLAVYDRSIAWFDFWLNGHENLDLASPEELLRWRALRKAMPTWPLPVPASGWNGTSSASPTPPHPPAEGAL